MPSYADNDPIGWGGDPQRGAALGRAPVDDPGPDTYKTPLTLKRVPIDDQGYDPLGTYFGVDRPLYWLASEDGKIDRVFRAKDDASAVALAGNMYTNAKINPKIQALVVEVGDIELDGFTRSYLETALWAETDHADEQGGKPLDENYSIEDFDPAFVLEAKRICGTFQELEHEQLERAYEFGNFTDEDAGSAFWLSHNGHESPFRNRGLGEAGDALADASQTYGAVDLYVGDDGKIYG